MLSLLAGRGSIVQGTAVDISPDGLRLSLPIGQGIGHEVEVFLPARPDRPGESGLTVTGRVVWESADADGTFTVGIRLYEDAPATTEISSRAEAEAVIARVREELRARSAGGPEAVVQVSPVAEKKKRRAIPLLNLFGGCGVVALLAALAFYAFMHVALNGANIDPGASNPELQSEQEERIYLDTAQAALMNGQPAAALKQMAGGGEDPRSGAVKSPAGRIIQALAYADALRMEGRSQEAAVALKKALAKETTAPAQWRSLAEQFRKDLEASGVEATAPPLLMDALELLRPGETDPSTAKPTRSETSSKAVSPRQDKSESPPNASVNSAKPPEPLRGTPAENLRMEVNASDYVLTLFRDGKPVATYPVGLGVDAKTPLGDFTIANKLIDPDWYNKGERVKAGDARNPLGKHWMGLGDKVGPTSYGIHETKDAKSIGANLSRGCIRMRPSDAAELFRMVGVGTPVRIVP